MINLVDKILRFLAGKEDPVSIQTILKGLGLPRDDRSFLRSQLRELTRSGQVEKHGAKYWVPQDKGIGRQLKKAKHQSVKAKLSMTSKGFGYATLLEGVSGRRGESRDWMIPVHLLGKARHGDIVLVDWQGLNRGRPFGKVTRILKFGSQFLTGILRQTQHGMLFHPFHPHESPIPVPAGLERKLKAGYVAVFQRKQADSWVFKKMIGTLDDPSIDEEMVLSEQGIIHHFPDDVLAEAGELESRMEDNTIQRESFEHCNVFTVDGADARDFDDAIHIVKKESSGYELGVHIADVSHYVTPGSNCDRHASVLGNSTYLPHKAFPMLPRVLSENLCSLIPGVKRLTLSVIMQLDDQGSLLDYRIVKGWIVSRHRLNYGQVFAMGVEKDPDARAQFFDVVEDIDSCLILADRLHEARLDQGGLNIQSVEPRMILNDQNMMEKIWGQSGDESHQMIEMFMCLANETVAAFMASQNLLIPFRVHEPPEEKRILTFIEFLLASGVRIPHGLDLTSGHSLNRIMDEMEARGNPASNALWKTLLLRSLMRAQYSVENAGHFGLGLNYYAHFTSPIRRYADLVLHQILSGWLDHTRSGDRNRDSLILTCEHLSDCERQSADAERQFFRLKILRHLQPRVGDLFEGKISDVKKFGIFVELTGLFVSGLISIDKLDDDYRLKGYALVGQRKRKTYKIGDSVKVVLERLDLETRSMDLGFSARSQNEPRRTLLRGWSGKARARRPVGKKTNSRKKASRKKTGVCQGSCRSRKRKRR
jgi:ribonuclease R